MIEYIFKIRLIIIFFYKIVLNKNKFLNFNKRIISGKFQTNLSNYIKKKLVSINYLIYKLFFVNKNDFNQ